jgi:hypothetical protein
MTGEPLKIPAWAEHIALDVRHVDQQMAVSRYSIGPAKPWTPAPGPPSVGFHEPRQRSGITASMVTAAMPGLDALQVDDGAVYWLERTPETGRATVVRLTGQSPVRRNALTEVRAHGTETDFFLDYSGRAAERGKPCDCCSRRRTSTSLYSPHGKLCYRRSDPACAARELTRSGDAVPYSAPQTASASADSNALIVVDSRCRIRSGDASDSAWSNKPAGLMM